MRNLFLFAALLLLSQKGAAQNVSLQQYMNTDSEIEAYAQYYDTRPNNVFDSIVSIRQRYNNELNENGYYPSIPENAWRVKSLNKKCVIVRREPMIIGKPEGKTTFHHNINE
jgi:hypothetical protein